MNTRLQFTVIVPKILSSCVFYTHNWLFITPTDIFDIVANSLPSKEFLSDNSRCRMETCFDFDKCQQFKEIIAFRHNYAYVRSLMVLKWLEGRRRWVCEINKNRHTPLLYKIYIKEGKTMIISPKRFTYIQTQRISLSAIVIKISCNLYEETTLQLKLNLFFRKICISFFKIENKGVFSSGNTAKSNIIFKVDFFINS